MKKTLVKIENKIVSIFDKVLEFIDKNKITTVLGLIAIIVLVFSVAIVVGNKKQANSSSNLSNLGFALDVNGKVYYIGYNNGTSDGIYRINGKNKEKITDDYGYYLNRYKKYIYYLDTTDRNIVKMKTNGKDKEIVIENVDEEIVTVKDNYIYYFANSYFYRVKVNGENKKRISNKSIENYQIVGNLIYYTYRDNGKYCIAKMKTNGEDVEKIESDCGSAFYLEDGYIYYIYEDVEEETNYELYRMKINGKNKKKIADINGYVDISTINFTNLQVYYLKKDTEGKCAIYKIDLKTKKESKIVDLNGFTTKINVMDKYIYYPDINDNGDVEVYRVKTNGKNKEVI